jgi:hypothetical protein
MVMATIELNKIYEEFEGSECINNKYLQEFKRTHAEIFANVTKGRPATRNDGVSMEQFLANKPKIGDEEDCDGDRARFKKAVVLHHKIIADAVDSEEEDDETSPTVTQIINLEDFNAQKKFASSLSKEERETIMGYKGNAFLFTTPLLTGRPPRSGVDPVVKLANREAYGIPRDRVMGFVPQFMGHLANAIHKAPKLSKEIVVYRGIHSDRALSIEGNNLLSTTYCKDVADEFIGEKCCLLNITVKPGVRIIVLGIVEDEDAGLGMDDECEIIICPPYKARVEDAGPGAKNVTITPVERWRAGTRRRKNKRRTLRKVKRSE